MALINKCLKTKIRMPNGTISTSQTGTPQGSVLSPILANIVLHTLDEYIEKYTLDFKIGKYRRQNPGYTALVRSGLKALKMGDKKGAFEAIKNKRLLPKGDPMDSNFKRMLYVRYADDFVVLIIGSHDDCLKIKSNIKEFILDNCGLELNEEKTTISLTTKHFSFLGADLVKLPRGYISKSKSGRKSVANTYMQVKAPIQKLIKTLKTAGFIKMRNNGTLKPIGLTYLINLPHYEILRFYNSKINGILNYYEFATNRSKL